MTHQSSWRTQRSKGTKFEKTLQCAILLVVFLWLLYQIKHIQLVEKDHSYDSNAEHTGFILGRKGNAGLDTNYGKTDIEMENIIVGNEKGSENGGTDDDDVSERFPEENNEDIRKKTSNGEYGDSMDNEDNNSSETQEYKDNNASGIGNLEELASNENDLISSSREGDEAVTKIKEPPEIEDYAATLPNSLVNASGNDEDEDDINHITVQSFQDENGVPEDLDITFKSWENELSKSTKNMTSSRNYSLSVSKTNVLNPNKTLIYLHGR